MKKVRVIAPLSVRRALRSIDNRYYTDERIVPERVKDGSRLDADVRLMVSAPYNVRTPVGLSSNIQYSGYELNLGICGKLFGLVCAFGSFFRIKPLVIVQEAFGHYGDIVNLSNIRPYTPSNGIALLDKDILVVNDFPMGGDFRTNYQKTSPLFYLATIEDAVRWKIGWASPIYITNGEYPISFCMRKSKIRTPVDENGISKIHYECAFMIRDLLNGMEGEYE